MRIYITDTSAGFSILKNNFFTTNLPAGRQGVVKKCTKVHATFSQELN